MPKKTLAKENSSNNGSELPSKPIRVVSIDEVAQRLYAKSGYNETFNQTNSRFALFLGAGASVDSNIILANQMIDEFKNIILKVKCRDNGLKRKVEKITRTISDAQERNKKIWEILKDLLEDKDRYEEESTEYSKYFEACYPKEVDRRNYIETIVSKAKLSSGYIMLAYLIEKGTIKTIITTNFDDLVYFACTSYTSTRPVVYAHGGFASEVAFSTARAKILKLHGDFLYSDLKNLDREINRQVEKNGNPRGVVEELYEKFNMKQQVMQALREGEGLIVIGYAGNDKTVMDLLHTMPKGHYLYWCVVCNEDENPEDKININVRELLQKKDGFLVRIKGFNHVMKEICQAVGIDKDAILKQFDKRQKDLENMLRDAEESDRVPEASSSKAKPRKNKTQDKSTEKFTTKLDNASESRSLFRKGDKAFNSGDWVKAEDFYRAAIELNPNYSSVYINLGFLLEKDKNRQHEAENAYRKAIEIDPYYAGTYNKLGSLLARDPKRQEEAEKMFRQAIKIDPDYAPAYNNLGFLLAKDPKQRKETEKLLRRTIELNPMKAETYNNLGSLLAEDAKRQNEAEKLYRQAIEIDSSYAPAYNNLGSLLAKDSKRQKEAEKLLRRAIEIDQHYAAAYNNLGSLLAKKPEKRNEAEKLLHQAIKLDEKDAAVYDNLGILFLLKRQFQDALKMFEKSLSLNTKSVSPLIRLANLYKHLENDQKFKEYFQQAENTVSTDDWYNLACLDAISDNPDSAIENLRKAIKDDPYNREKAKYSISLKWISDDPRFKELVGED